MGQFHTELQERPGGSRHTKLVLGLSREVNWENHVRDIVESNQ